ncbi:ankyrin repeat-containing protein [Tritrichomonas foetus]|uniref:Ankyrin repeat-containing protein n=1 Tax=Tritrichomonas foetus TaxID=1144522 RepID=A0A1J4KD75_9EUKA|nr:ankyrin repeat-containing protein [Tritrichomonas foetus]|eukprot:OHT07405.1 ankyrin repeat-containing protein [Tritrichomonas foetus]
MNGNIELVEILIRYGAQVNSTSNQTHDIVKAAIEANAVECLKLFLQYISKPEDRYYSVIMQAIIQLHFDAVPILVEAGMNPNHIINGKTAISFACFNNATSVVKYLSKHVKEVDLPADGVIYDGYAVHWICQSCDLEICKILLEKGIDVNRVNNRGWIGPHYLVDKDPSIVFQIVTMLFAHGLVIDRLLPGQKISILNEFQSSIKKRKYQDLINWLIEHGAV